MDNLVSSSASSSSRSDLEEFELMLDEEIESRHRRRTRRTARRYNARINYCELLNDAEFRMRFRLNKRSVEYLVRRVGQGLVRSTRNHGITPLYQILLALRFYAMGSMLLSVGDFIGVSTSSACRIISIVSRRIVAELFAETVFMSANSSRGFCGIARFPHVVGVVDGTHIEIQSPGGINAEEYRNRKGYFSLNVQSVCDSKLKFVDIVARWPGSTHDSTIFNHSNLKIRFDDGEFEGKWLLGDSAYPSKPYLLTPLSNPLTPQEVLYNEALIRTRNAIERCIGVWKRRFPVVGLKIRLSLPRVMSVVYATAILHNMAINEKIELPPPEMEIRAMPAIPQHSLRQNRDDATRSELINTYFASLVRGHRQH